MYLLHATLAGQGGRAVPHDTAALVAGSARPEDRLEHVALHLGDPLGGPRSEPGSEPGGDRRAVLGLFLIADSLADAERTATELCLRALEECSELRGLRLLSCGAAMPPAYYDGLLGAARDEQVGRGLWPPA
jgi:hypothetical protein